IFSLRDVAFRHRLAGGTRHNAMAGHVPVPHASSQPLAADPYFTTEARERGRPARWRSGISRAWHLAQCVLRVPMDRSAPGDALAAGAVRWEPFDLRPAAWRLAIRWSPRSGGIGASALWSTITSFTPLPPTSSVPTSTTM